VGMYVKKECFKLIDVPNLSISDTLVISSPDVAYILCERLPFVPCVVMAGLYC